MDLYRTDKEVPQRIVVLLYWGMRAFVGLAAIGFLLEGEWVRGLSALAIVALMLLPGFLKNAYRFYMPIQFDVAITGFIFLTLFLGSLGDFYEKYWWWDRMLHFCSGILLGVVGFAVIYYLNDKRFGKLSLSPLFSAFFSVCFSMTMSVVWEIYEFAVDQTLGFQMQRDGINDTMTDLILNLAASAAVALAAYYWLKRAERKPAAQSKLSRYQYRGRAHEARS